MAIAFCIHKYRQIDRHANRQTNKYTETEREGGGEGGKEGGRQAGREGGRQAGRQTGRRPVPGELARATPETRVISAVIRRSQLSPTRVVVNSRARPTSTRGGCLFSLDELTSLSERTRSLYIFTGNSECLESWSTRIMPGFLLLLFTSDANEHSNHVTFNNWSPNQQHIYYLKLYQEFNIHTQVRELVSVFWQ